MYREALCDEAVCYCCVLPELPAAPADRRAPPSYDNIPVPSSPYAQTYASQDTEKVWRDTPAQHLTSRSRGLSSRQQHLRHAEEVRMLIRLLMIAVVTTNPGGHIHFC